MMDSMWKKTIGYGTEKVLVYCLNREKDELYLLHNYDKNPGFPKTKECWILPFGGKEEHEAYGVRAEWPFEMKLKEEETEVTILFDERESESKWSTFQGIPYCDIMGNRMELDFPHGELFEKAMYHFYWGTLLPSIVEKTRAITYPVSSGYVVSTLQEGAYAGTYPDVDHEFQIKGRMALASEMDLAMVRRMMELQLMMMEQDPEQAYRNPCAVQPDGTREYHVRRNSMDGSENAEMFLVTGNIEIIESAWLYYAATKDLVWLKQHMEGLEHALSLVESCIDAQGRLWSDVYYEDQVIKDGRECMSASLAAKAFEEISQLEAVLERHEQELRYKQIASKLKEALIGNLPGGFWNETKKRFADWVDRNSKQHDHIHLLANELPVLFHYATPEQEKSVNQLMEDNFKEFQRFPSFVSAKIEHYTDAEIGSGGPYDLCAAGRYWCWDFAYWMERKRKDVLEQQLLQVCQQGELDAYQMGERYDMNYIYYQSDKNWHGAAHYYEYPCVFIWNLVEGYLGFQFSLEADLVIKPMLNQEGRVRMENPLYGVEYEVKGGNFSFVNLLDRERTFVIKWKEEEKRINLQGKEKWVW